MPAAGQRNTDVVRTSPSSDRASYRVINQRWTHLRLPSFLQHGLPPQGPFDGHPPSLAAPIAGVSSRGAEGVTETLSETSHHTVLGQSFIPTTLTQPDLTLLQTGSWISNTPEKQRLNSLLTVVWPLCLTGNAPIETAYKTPTLTLWFAAFLIWLLRQDKHEAQHSDCRRLECLVQLHWLSQYKHNAHSSSLFSM